MNHAAWLIAKIKVPALGVIAVGTATATPQDRPAIILGDFNLHHELWSCAAKNNIMRSQRFLDWMSDTGFALLNKKGEVTYTPHSEEGSSSVLDLTFVNAAAINEDTVKEWSIDRSMSYGSDHHGIRWKLHHGRTEIDNITGARYNLKDVDPEDWSKAVRDELERQRDGIRPSWTMTAQVAPERKPNVNAKPWWNKELKEAAENPGKVQSELKNYEASHGFHSRDLRAKVKKVGNLFKRLCKATKA
ncbi:endonuclease-reverse transcriptase-domain-containing protein, partial [Mycena rosella]